MAGTLYVVATPIGNLEDITLRALRVLGEVAVIACEDTRVTRKLLAHHQIHTPTLSWHAHSDEGVLERIVARLVAGEDVALVTDAGTPGISDPGQALVARAAEAGARVVPIPGASALAAAVSASGLPAARVLFLGFLPRDDAERVEVLAPLRDAPYTLVVYEAPSRASEALALLARVLGPRRACVARELTKKFEELRHGTLPELAATFAEEARGEMVIVVAPADPTREPPAEDAHARARALLAAGTRPADAARILAGALGLTRQEAYRVVMEVKGEG